MGIGGGNSRGGGGYVAVAALVAAVEPAALSVSLVSLVSLFFCARERRL